MTNPDGHIVIAGAGLTGLMAARLISTKVPAKRITIIESSHAVGGNYRSADYGEQGSFDQGMRMFYETGIPEFDQLIQDILPKDAWHIYRGNHKDIAGTYWNASLQSHSPYLDLRTLPNDAMQACKKDFLATLEHNTPLDKTNAATYATSRFGKAIAHYICEALEALYAQPAHKLHVTAMHQPTMNRVILYEEPELTPLLGDDAVRARIAWPNQLTLPPLRTYDQAALYPKKYGMQHVIDALQTQLINSGVTITLADTITAIHQRGESIEALETQNGTTITNIQQLYWTGNMPALAKLINAPIPKQDALPLSTMVHLLLPEKPDMGALYHFYCFDKALHTFRITDYARYCPQAKQSAGYPICIELWHLQPEEDAVACALREALQLGIMQDTSGIVVCGVTTSPNFHAACSLEQVNATQTLRQAITQKMPHKAQLIGTFSNEHQMLLYEIWNDMYHRIMAHHG